MLLYIKICENLTLRYCEEAEGQRSNL